MPRLVSLLFLASLTALSGCTTYTWPDGSRETVMGVPAEEENRRYEEPKADGVRYRIPGEQIEQPNRDEADR